MSDNIKTLIEKQNVVVTALREELDSVKSDAGKVARMEATLMDVVEKLDAAELKNGRPNAAAAAKANEEKNAFMTFVQKGERALTSEQKAMSFASADPQDGSYSVPQEFEDGIIEFLQELNPMRQLGYTTTTGTADKEFLYEIGEAAGGWVAELDERTPTATPKIGVIKVPVHELYAEPSATPKILQDSLLNLETWLTRQAAERLARVEAKAFLNGTGVGQASGLLLGVGPTQATQTTLGAVAADASGITGDNIINQIYSLNQHYAGTRAKFMGNKLTIAAIHKLKDNEGRYIWQPSIQAGVPSTLFGYDFVTNSDMDTPDVAGGNWLVFGDLMEAYTIVDRPGSFRILRDDITDKRYVEFYTTYRVGGAVTNGFAANVLVGSP